MHQRLPFALLLGLLLGAGSARAQGGAYQPSKERVDPLERRRDEIQGNNIRATITNWNQTGQSGQPGDFAYEFPKNTRRIYISLSQLWVGARMTGSAGGPLSIVDVADFRTNPDGASRKRWTFQPIRGYVNPAASSFGIAQSDVPASWPAQWPDKLTDTADPGWSGSWNGFFGKDQFNADQEFFFKAGDDQYDRFTNAATAPSFNGQPNRYFPDSTDASRSGLGIVTESRVLAWSQVLIDDVVFAIYGVKNDGTKDLPQVGISAWLADIVGGDAGDQTFFDLGNDIVFMRDFDQRGTAPFGTDVVGVAGIAFLETPGNSTNRIDDDGDGSTIPENPGSGETGSPLITDALIAGEAAANGIDDNGNGLVDESEANLPFNREGVTSPGVGYADYVDNDGDGETGGPVVTQEIVNAAAGDRWNRYPANPENDPLMRRANGTPIVHLVGVTAEDLGKGYKDNIDNDNSSQAGTSRFPYLSETGGPVVTQAIVTAAAGDALRRYRVPGTNIVLMSVGAEDVGKAYADGVDNDRDGAVDEGIDEGIDEMIDESRDDGIDNDGDWDPLRDDTGLDGVAFSGDRGDGDRVPSTGAGTDLPGEKNVDKTDVSESDQIGVTNVQRIPAFTIQLNQQSDALLFNTYMIPGDIDDEPPPPTGGEDDFVVSSGLFPLRAGQTERISIAFAIAASGRTNLENQQEVLRTIGNARDAYAADYQFAQAPLVPTLTAVPGDGQVTLYWDSIAEESNDQFLADIGLPSRDFEGYLLYRSTDPAFLDPLVITDGRGNLTYRRPIARFDLRDGRLGFHPVSVNGTQFDLGTDSGLQHSFVDSTALNGITYYYAVTAYDYGAPSINISPTETPILIERRADGTISTGPNVRRVTPQAPVAGFENARIPEIKRAAGFTTSRVGYRIVDPTALTDGRRYRLVFQDTLKLSGNASIPDTLTTKNFSLVDVATGDTLIRRSTAFRQGQEFPLFTDAGERLGFQLQFFPDPLVTYNADGSGWNDPKVFPLTFEPYLAAGFLKGLRNPADYKVEIVGDGAGRSTRLEYRRNRFLQARPTNVRVTNTSTGQEVKYAFLKATRGAVDLFTDTAVRFEADTLESDLLILIEPRVGAGGQEIVTWQIGLSTLREFRGRESPGAGDVATIKTKKPFLRTDVFEFEIEGARANADSARSALSAIRVVPNPYRAANSFEGQSAFNQGRGPRQINFTRLPPDCTLRIFTLDGRLVKTLRMRDGVNDPTAPEALLNGTLSWDLLSEDNISVSYGIYLYHVEAPGMGEKTGRFVIIK